ncbi:hypothetical protein GCM10010464_33920 [Pseudonocardia yunnanensis]|uniref:Uncharacterized protein n=1 Tax=Pseudonocardia yunnanensis TaxID=58107 RepID=A0ABW4EKP0_9PSEU
MSTSPSDDQHLPKPYWAKVYPVGHGPEIAPEPGDTIRSPAAMVAPPVVNGRVRQFVDLTQAEFDAFTKWKVDAALDLGWARVTTQDVLRAAVQMLVSDRKTERRVFNKIADNGMGTY